MMTLSRRNAKAKPGHRHSIELKRGTLAARRLRSSCIPLAYVSLPTLSQCAPKQRASGMERLKLTFALLFQSQLGPDVDVETALERMIREIRGSMWGLVTLFLFLAFVSYLPIDNATIASGHLEDVRNLGGPVGAYICAYVLGALGASGYLVLLMFAWMSLAAFAGMKFRDNVLRLAGGVLSMLLLSMSLQLTFGGNLPEWSLLQGGWIGMSVGSQLRQFFGPVGAMLLVCGGFLFTAIVTASFSFQTIAKLIWQEERAEQDNSAELEETDDLSSDETEVDSPSAETRSTPKKRSKKKSLASLEEDSLETEEESPTENVEQGPYEHRPLIPVTSAYNVPSTRLLKNAEGGVKRLSRSEMRDNADKLIEHLLSFQITGEITSISQGPVLITYEFKPSAGVKLSKIAGLQDDLGIVMGTNQLRIIAPIPGKTVVGIEIPRPQSETIALKDVLSEKAFYDKKLKLPVALGKSTDGSSVIGDLAAMPHLLVAGATGSGKSVFMNSLIMSFLLRLSPTQLRLILIDPKMLEFAAFQGIPHLIAEVITDNKKALNALNWAVWEMDRRYAMMAKTSAKNIESFNSKESGKNKLPYIVVVIDELADLMMSGGEEAEISITRLAQKARAAGIHLVIATQRPSAEVITGLIKANVPSRISFKVPSGIDSRTILDTSGAEELIGRGDSLVIQPGIPLRRLHGTFVTEEELARVVKYVKDGKNHSKNFIDFSGSPASAA